MNIFVTAATRAWNCSNASDARTRVRGRPVPTAVRGAYAGSFRRFGVRSDAPWAGFDDTGMNDVDADDPEAMSALSDALPGGLNDV